VIKSMTGYGGAKGEITSVAVTVELKSVNNRYLEVSARLPKSCLFAEELVRAAVAEHISRGKVDVFVTVDTSAAAEIAIQVNEPLAAAYLTAIRGMAVKYSLKDDLTVLALARFPDVLSEQKLDADQNAVVAAVKVVLEQALKDYDAMRIREGEKLCADLQNKLTEIESLVTAVEARAPETVADYRTKLTERMNEVLAETGVDEARILQEAALYADRIAVDEETVRLRSHIAQFRHLLCEGSPVGRKLDFLIQEMNREANTIGSKCSDTAIAKTVIELKAEIEKIREQVQNIE
jgi:uncharacterized protein (TIGR00255 family)